MCLIIVAYKVHPNFPLIVLGNRDEFYSRATRQAHFWSNHPNVFAGRDIESPDINNQGTWMGINKAGRFAAVTNFREMDFNEAGAKRSRGELTANYLCATTSIKDYLNKVYNEGENYKGFNLLLWEKEQLLYTSNRVPGIQQLTAGIYGLSNGILDSSWPKVTRAKQQLQTALEHTFNEETLLDILLNDEQAPDELLPDTGIDIESERLLSACFIRAEGYGTRASTCVLIDSDQQVTFLEKNWSPTDVHKKSVAEEQRFLKLPCAKSSFTKN